jgi:hypothetical protein
MMMQDYSFQFEKLDFEYGGKYVCFLYENDKYIANVFFDDLDIQTNMVNFRLRETLVFGLVLHNEKQYKKWRNISKTLTTLRKKQKLKV